MNRALVAGVSMVTALTLTAPSFASNSRQNVTQAPASVAPALKVVTGEVLMSTPDYVVLATPSGMQRFQITPESKIIGGTAEGDEITIHYKVVQVPGRSTVAANAARATSAVARVEPAAATAGRPAQDPAH